MARMGVDGKDRQMARPSAWAVTVSSVLSGSIVTVGWPWRQVVWLADRLLVVSA
jgi:hypothetical protein